MPHRDLNGYFSGDTHTTWDSLDFQPRFTATAANVGYTWWSHDIGGHMLGVKDSELTVRWFQFGVFSPINRLHSSPSPFFSKEPWAQGAAAFAVIAPYLRLRHRLIPALYTAAWQAHTDAVAVVRPVYHDWPQNRLAYTVPNQYLLGEHLLVAPITAPEDDTIKLATVRAWLPDGGWFDIFTGQHYDGGSHVVLHRGIEQLPVLARAGTVLPLAEAMEPVTDAPDRLTLRVFPGDGVSHLIEDHGEGAPTAADRNITRFVQTLTPRDDGRADLRLVIEPTTGHHPRREREIVLEIVGVSGDEDHDNARLAEDELLSPALRIDLGRLDLTRETEVELTGLVPATLDRTKETFTLLDAAEIEYLLKTEAWSAIRRSDGLALAQELASLGLPPILRDAILERVSATRPW